MVVFSHLRHAYPAVEVLEVPQVHEHVEAIGFASHADVQRESDARQRDTDQGAVVQVQAVRAHLQQQRQAARPPELVREA